MVGIKTRYYGFDALRACMMLAGIVFHLAIPYAGVLFRGYYVTEESHPLLKLILVFHYFRMPTFFLLSGFFSAMLWEYQGPRAFLRTRTKRFGLVWLAALAVTWPLMIPISVYNHFASQPGKTWALTWSAISSFQIAPAWLPEAPLHLWFLEYLFVFCLAAAAILSLFGRWMPFLDNITGTIGGSRFRLLALAIPTVFTRRRMPFAVAPYPSSFIPWLGISLDYGWFYAVGWLLYRRRELLPQFARTTLLEKVAVPLTILMGILLIQQRVRVGYDTGAPLLDSLIALVTALFIWSTILVLIAALYRIQANKSLPYFADASYWIYLAHFPLACLLPTLLRGWHVSPLVKVAFSAAAIFGILLLTYDRLIRYGAIGRALNGLRVPNTRG